MKAVKRTESVSWTCDQCFQKIENSCGPISVQFPYPHPHDSCEGPKDFCSDYCLIKFLDNSALLFGAWSDKQSGINYNKVTEKATTFDAFHGPGQCDCHTSPGSFSGIALAEYSKRLEWTDEENV